MENNEIINNVLSKYSNKTSILVTTEIKAKNPELNDHDAYYIVEIMEEEGLIEKVSPSGYNHKITVFGRKILEIGGWLEYQKMVEIERIKKEKIKEDELEKLQIDLRLGRLKLKTFWPLFWIAAIGGVLGMLAFFGVKY
jgi:hypothetical protein